MKIVRLTEDFIDKMLCYEIINTSVNIIKELIDNSIDAQANIVKIYITDKHIIVKDNGCGMSLDDLLLCTNKYTTSKSCTREFLGFRGMALYNIKKISSILIESRLSDSNYAIKMDNNGISYTHGEKGTIIYVSNIHNSIHLSSNVLIGNLIKQYVIKYENIKFSLNINKKNYYYSKDNLLFKNNKGIYSFGENDYNGYIIKNNRNEHYMYFNNYCIFNQSVHDSIMSAWKKVSSNDTNISYCIFIRIPSEISFISSGKNFIDLSNFNIIENIYNSIYDTFKKHGKESKLQDKLNNNTNFIENNVNYLGVIYNRYILCSCVNDLLLIDAHAAHERIVSEKLKKNLYYMQSLLMEIGFAINDEQKDMIEEKKLFLICKFYIKDNMLYITHIISILNYLDMIFIDLLDKIFYNKHQTAENVLYDFFHDYGCKNSMRHNHLLYEQDCKEIIKQLFTCDYCDFCNHGRRTYIKLSLNDLNRMFER